MQVIFWNINNNKTALDEIAKQCEKMIDDYIFGFCEFWNLDISYFNRGKVLYSPIDKRVALIYSSTLEIKSISFTKNYLECEISTKYGTIIVFVVHLKSQLQSESASESFNRRVCSGISDLINGKHKDSKVIVMGDFNLSHYDDAICDFYHLNVTNYVDQRAIKKFEGASRRKLYSPFMSMIGDHRGNVPGSYYYNLPHQSQGWHLFDQIIVSYELAGIISKEKTKILTEINNKSLTTASGLPNHEYSDHLPLSLKIG